MPHAWPLGRERYVQYLRTTPDAPRREPARTHEVKGKRRHGEGVAYRLFGSHAFVLGRWTGRAWTEQERAEFEYQSQQGERMDPWGRLIRPDEIDTVAGQVAQEKFDEGWQPPLWHWRFYWEKVSGVLNNVGLMNVRAYNEGRWTIRRFFIGWLRFFYDMLKMRLFPVEQVDPPTQLAEWRERRAEDDEDGLAL